MTHKRVGPIRGEVAVHQIRRPHRVGVLTGGEHLLATPGDALDAQLTHQPGDLVPADVVAGPTGAFQSLWAP